MTHSSSSLLTLSLVGALFMPAPPRGVAQGTHRATLTVHWSQVAKEEARGKPGFTALVRSSNETRETLEAMAVFEIPDAGYGRMGLAAFGHAGGQVIGPEYEEVGGGPRRKLPPARLLSFGGHTTHEAHGHLVTQDIGSDDPPCEVTTSAKGEGDFAAGRPGEGTRQQPTVSFQFTPRAATFMLTTMATFPVKEEAISKCKDSESATRLAP